MITAHSFLRERVMSLLAACVMMGGGVLAQNGVLDVTFSGDGQLGSMPQIPDVITIEILETGGFIFPILSAVNGTTSAYIMKLNEDGSLNNDFGTGGILEFPNTGFSDAVLSRDESRILLLSGSTDGYQIRPMDLNGLWLQAWTPLDVPGGGGFAKMLVDDQGRICIGKGAYVNDAGCGQVIRLNEDFTTDNTFGTNGVAYTSAAPFGYPLFEIDNAGRLVLASYGLGSAGIWRFNADGTIDPSFNYTLDLALYSVDNWILDIAIARDNSIYVQPNTWGYPAYLFKVLENGSLDAGFGTGGYMDLTDADPLYYTAPDELLIEPNGGLIILAQTYGADGYMSAKYLTRLDEFGAIDAEFDPGVQPIDDDGYSLRINFHCATLQDDGKVLSMDQVVKWQNGELFGYAPLITRFNNEKGSVIAAVSDVGPHVVEVYTYPNPTTGHTALHLSGSGPLQNATIIITTNVGALVRQEQLMNERIDLSALPAGVYHCTVRYDEGSLHARVVKE